MNELQTTLLGGLFFSGGLIVSFDAWMDRLEEDFLEHTEAAEQKSRASEICLTRQHSGKVEIVQKKGYLTNARSWGRRPLVEISTHEERATMTRDVRPTVTQPSRTLSRRVIQEERFLANRACIASLLVT